MPTVPSIQPVPQLPTYRWNEAARQYISPSGKFVPRAEIRGALDDFITSVTKSMGDVADRLIGGEISLAEWQTTMMELSKQANLAGTAMESGGWFQLGPEEFGRAGNRIRNEYNYLREFASQIESGKQPLNGTLRRRAQLYGEQGRVTYYDAARASAKSDGFNQERSILNPADHCDSCVEQAAKGWSPIESLIPIGSRTCRSNCKCYMAYRKSSGETRIV